MSSGNANYLLALKKASIHMAAASGYDISEDLPVLEYKPEDLHSYIDYAKDMADTNAIRKAFNEQDLLTDRSCLSTIYESKDRPNNFVLICFVPVPKQKNMQSVKKPIIQIPVSVCARYTFSKQKYCTSCTKKFEGIKRCYKCPTQQYCDECTQSLKCDKCTEDKFCTTCVNKQRKINIYKLAREKCSTCKEDYCSTCEEMLSTQECKECSQIKTLEDKDKCQTCLSKIKCKECPSSNEEGEEFCEDCETKFSFEKCKECPLQTFCRECVKTKNIIPCSKCPTPPQIIERCIIISESDLSSEAKQVAIANIPKIKASTGEWIETGCLIQVFRDYDVFYNPLVHSFGARYEVMSIEKTIEFFKSKDNNVTEGQMYQMDMSGPICKYLGLYPGQLVRIEREILIPGTMLTHEVIYRIVKLIPIVKKNRRRGLKKRTVTTASGASTEDL